MFIAVVVSWVLYLVTKYVGYVFGRNGIMPADESDTLFFLQLAIIVTAIVMTLLFWRILYLYRLYRYGVEVTGHIFFAEAKSRMSSVQYEYIYNSEPYQREYVLDKFVFDEHNFHEGQEVTLLVDTKKPKRAVIRDIYF